MRYLLIDCIVRLECNKQILAIKNVALSEDVYSEYFVGFPVMPGALLIEALAQAGTALLEVSANFKKKALLIMVNNAKFRALVHPGDQLTVAVRMLARDDHSAQMDGTIHIASRLVTSARLTFAMKNAAEIYVPAAQAMVETIYRTWLRNAEIVGSPQTQEKSHV
jgi:3-hydroxyacyl-[acyl-carrier-protein] dehydratase